MKFRKKPVVIEAEQYFLGKEIEGVVELEIPYKVGDMTFVAIRTSEDIENPFHYIRESDYIINENGKFSTCREDIFLESYEQVEEHVEPHYNS